MKTNHKHRRRAAIETLEDRRLFSVAISAGVLTITGSHVSTVDWVNVQESGGMIVVQEGTSGEALPQTGQFLAGDVTQIVIETGDGPDHVVINTSKLTTVRAGSGNDEVLVGNSPTTTAANFISGDSGNDMIICGAGNDSVNAGTATSGESDTVFGGRGNDALYGNGANDGNDWLFGEDGDDVIYGNGGNDHLYGGNGHDQLFGGMGGDTCYGGAGNDVFREDLSGSEQRNFLYGESGDDTFRVKNGLFGDYVDGGVGNDTAYYDRHWMSALSDRLVNIESKIA
jgi:Ca2+-binding RTX toxin-like protein